MCWEEATCPDQQGVSLTWYSMLREEMNKDIVRSTTGEHDLFTQCMVEGAYVEKGDRLTVRGHDGMRQSVKSYKTRVKERRRTPSKEDAVELKSSRVTKVDSTYALPRRQVTEPLTEWESQGD
jgi:hypothetical protein